MRLSVVNATKYIKRTLILDNINLELHGGAIYGLQGPNGSGKTMLMRMIAGLIQPSSGKVLVDERQLGKDMDFPSSMGLLIENPAFLPNYTGFQNLKMLAQLKKKVDEKQVRQAIVDVGLDPSDKRKFRKYSLGMKQRLGIAAAIMEKPDVILLDEPTNALDPVGIDQICRIIVAEKKRGALIILASHDASFLEPLADEMYFIYDGRVERVNV